MGLDFLRIDEVLSICAGLEQAPVLHDFRCLAESTRNYLMSYIFQHSLYRFCSYFQMKLQADHFFVPYKSLVRKLFG